MATVEGSSYLREAAGTLQTCRLRGSATCAHVTRWVLLPCGVLREASSRPFLVAVLPDEVCTIGQQILDARFVDRLLTLRAADVHEPHKQPITGPRCREFLVHWDRRPEVGLPETRHAVAREPQSGPSEAPAAGPASPWPRKAEATLPPSLHLARSLALSLSLSFSLSLSLFSSSTKAERGRKKQQKLEEVPWVLITVCMQHSRLHPNRSNRPNRAQRGGPVGLGRFVPFLFPLKRRRAREGLALAPRLPLALSLSLCLYPSLLFFWGMREAQATPGALSAIFRNVSWSLGVGRRLVQMQSLALSSVCRCAISCWACITYRVYFLRLHQELGQLKPPSPARIGCSSRVFPVVKLVTGVKSRPPHSENIFPVQKQHQESSSEARCNFAPFVRSGCPAY